MSHLFEGCSKLKAIDLTGLDTSKVEDMSFLFDDCSALQTIELGGIDTSFVTNMMSMFYNCSALESIDVDIDTSRVTNMSSMFKFYKYTWPVEYTPESSLKHINFGSKFTTANVTLMSEMFYGCTQLEELDLSRFDRSNVTSINNFFGKYDTKLKKITLSDKMSINSACNLINKTTEFLGSAGWYNSTDPDQEIISTGTTGIILPAAEEGSTVTYMMAYNNPEIVYHFDSSTGTLTLTKGEMTSSQFKTLCTKATDNVLDIKKVVAGSDVKFTGSLYAMFQDLDAVEEVDLSAADMTQVTSMEYMFAYCKVLRSVKIGTCSNALTSLKQMFMGCSILNTIDISGLDTSEVTNMSDMFNSCSELESVNLSGLNTGKVTDMRYMFAYCKKLKSLDLSGFNTSLVTDMRGMFASCEALETITFGTNFTTAAVDMFYQMFYGCKALHRLDLSGFTFDSGDNINQLFQDADIRELTIPASLSLSSSTSLRNKGYRSDRIVYFTGWYNIANENTIVSGENSYAVFSGAGTYHLKESDTGVRYSLSGDTLTITAGTIGYQSNMGDDVSSIVSYLNSENNITIKTVVVGPNVRFYDNGYQFEKCDGVETIDLSHAVLQKAPDAQQDVRLTKLNSMFSSCPDLKTVLFPDTPDTSAVTQMYSMFAGCSSLRSLDLSTFDFSKITSMSSMFEGCYLTELKLPDSLTSITTGTRLTNFYCSDDLSQNYIGWAKKDTKDIISGNEQYAEFSGASGAGTYVWVENDLDYTFEDGTLTLKSGTLNSDLYGKLRSSLSSTPTKVVINGKTAGAVVLFGKCGSFFNSSTSPKVNVDIIGGLDTSRVTYMYRFFYGTKGGDLDMRLFDTSHVTDMSSLFSETEYDSVTFGDSFDTSAATNMSYMFYNAKINTVDLENLDTSHVTYFSGMFSGCSTVNNYDLSSLDFSNASSRGLDGLFKNSSIKVFDSNTLQSGSIPNVTSLSSMFEGCTKLTTVKFPAISCPAVTNTSKMFNGCTALTSVDLSALTAAANRDMSSMFNGCTALTGVDFGTNKVSDANYVNISNMFTGCTSLTEMDMAAFAGVKVTSMTGTFKNCTALTTITGLENVAAACGAYAELFSGCSALTTVNTTELQFSTSGYSNSPGFKSMFYNCSSLTEIDLSNLNMCSVYMEKMFAGCSALKKLTLGEPGTNVTLSSLNSSTYFPDMFDGDNNLTDLTIPKTMAIYSGFKLVNEDMVYTGWFKADDETKTVVSGTASYAAIASNTTGNVRYLREAKNYTSNMVKSASLTLEGQIGLNFYAAFPDSVLKNENAYVELSGPNGKQTVMIEDAPYDRVNGYKFTYQLAASQLHDKVTFSVYDGTSTEPLTLHNSMDAAIEGNAYSYAVVDYINTVKKTSNNNYLLNLVKSLEIYGTYAQKYFGYDTDSANESSLDVSSLNYVKNKITYSSVSSYKYSKPDYPEGLKLTGYALVLESTTTFKLYFECDDISKLKFHDLSSGILTPVNISGNQYVIEMKDIVAKKIADDHYIDIEDAETEDRYCRLKVSPLAYVYSALKQLGTSEDASDINLCNLMKAFRYYNTCAVNYFS